MGDSLSASSVTGGDQCELDFTGKTVVPFTTHAMSVGTTERDYAALCAGAAFAEGLAVKGEEVSEAEEDIASWLQRVHFAGA